MNELEQQTQRERAEVAFSAALAGVWLAKRPELMGRNIDELEVVESAQHIAEAVHAAAAAIDAVDVPHIDVIEMLVERAADRLSRANVPTNTTAEAIASFLEARA